MPYVPLGGEIQDLSLERDRGQVTVKGALTVRGDEEEGVRGGVHVANLAYK